MQNATLLSRFQSRGKPPRPSDPGPSEPSVDPVPSTSFRKNRFHPYSKPHHSNGHRSNGNASKHESTRPDENGFSRSDRDASTAQSDAKPSDGKFSAERANFPPSHNSSAARSHGNTFTSRPNGNYKHPKTAQDPSTSRSQPRLGNYTLAALKHPHPPARRFPQTFTPRVVSRISQESPYEHIAQVGEGTYGKVFKARHIHSGDIVALKLIRVERDGFPVTSLRELRFLQTLRSQYIISLRETVVTQGCIYMAFEYVDHDLTGILAHPGIYLAGSHCKYIAHGLLSGLAFMHASNVLHRDIKASNILISRRGHVKIADFGLASFYHSRTEENSNRVITLWYKPPELLMGAVHYGPEVDVWSAGCIFVELFTRKPILRGNDDLDQLSIIFSVFGSPTPSSWPQFNSYPWSLPVACTASIPDRFSSLFSPYLAPDALDLARALLPLNPDRRISCSAALQHPYFANAPVLEPLDFLQSLDGEWHELDMKQDKHRKKAVD